LLIAASYWATRLNAATENAKRVAADSWPSLASSEASSSAYCDGSVATATRAKFLAAERSMAGPPMSMFSTASARVQSALAVTDSNGYRFRTSRSMAPMPCSAITASSRPERPSRPPCTIGCRVLTRPSRHSGKPVSSSTRVTGTPAAAIVPAVEPVDTSSTPAACSAVASSVSPDLS